MLEFAAIDQKQQTEQALFPVLTYLKTKGVADAVIIQVVTDWLLWFSASTGEV